VRTPLVAGNWKMHKTPSEARVWINEFLDELGQVAGSGVAFGAQDVSAHDWGAFTGEVSAYQVADLGARYAVVGHSERRKYWREDSGLVAEKAKRALEAGLVPILCVGEELAVRTPGDAEVMAEALRSALASRYGEAFAGGVRVLYGGSIKPENFAQILAGPNVDGGLVGGASLEVASFAALVRLAVGL